MVPKSDLKKEIIKTLPSTLNIDSSENTEKKSEPTLPFPSKIESPGECLSLCLYVGHNNYYYFFFKSSELTSNPWRNRRCIKCRMVPYIKVPTGQRCSDSVSYRSVKRPPATKLRWCHFCLFAQWRFSTSATPDATEDVPAPVCFGCDLLRCCKTQEDETKPTCHFILRAKFFRRLRPDFRRCCVAHHGLVYFGEGLSRNQKIPQRSDRVMCSLLGSAQKKKQEKQQQRFERGQPALKFCANCVERARRRTIFGTFGVEGSSGARKCHSDTSQPASKSQPGATDHEVNCF